MIRKKTEDKIKDAFKTLAKHGILCYVPGCFDLVTYQDAVDFAKDREKFYKDRE